MSEAITGIEVPANLLPDTNLASFIFSNPFQRSTVYATQAPTDEIRRNAFDHPVAPSKPIFIHADTGAQISWLRLRHDVHRFADGFRNKLGLSPIPLSKDEPYTVSHPVLLHLPNCLPYGPIMLGAVAAGLTVTMCNPFYTATELAHVLNTAKPAVIFTTPAGLSVLQEAAQQIADREIERKYKEDGRVFVVDVNHDDYGISPNQSANAIMNRHKNGWLIADYKWLLGRPGLKIEDWAGTENAAKRGCFILWSSGTSGRSKGVVLTHRAMTSGTLLQWYGHPTYTLDERFITFVPFFHILGLATSVLMAPAIGLSVIVMPRFDLERFLQLASSHRATFLHMAPPVAVALAKTPLLAKYDLSSLKSVSCGGAPLPADVIRRVYERLGVLVKMGYGASEAGGITSQRANTWEELAPLLGTTGMPMPGVLIRIVDVNGEGKTLSVGDEGEIWIKSPVLMSGYLNDPETTRETLTPDGWYRSGDIGKLDEQGNLQITDRMKDMIKTSGFQCSPVEIEGVLAGHEMISDVAVGAVNSPEDGTEYPRAYVVPVNQELLSTSLKNGKASPELVDLAVQLNKRVESKLIKYKWLRGGVLFVEQVPKNPSGKILRRLFKDCKGIEVQVYQGSQKNREAKL